MLQRIPQAEAESKGFVVDRHCYPWFGYKGPRFRPTERVHVLTETERRLADALQQMLDEKADYMNLNKLGDPEAQHTVKAARAALSFARENI